MASNSINGPNLGRYNPQHLRVTPRGNYESVAPNVLRDLKNKYDLDLEDLDVEELMALLTRDEVELSEEAMDLLLKRGEDALDGGDAQAAIEHLTALTDHAPDFAEGWNARATAYFLAGQYGPSLSDIARTLALEPRHWGALAGLGAILDEMGNPEGALAAFRRSYALHPHQQDVKDAIDRLERQLAGITL